MEMGMRLPPRTEGTLSKGTVKQSHQIMRAAARLGLDEKRLISAAITRLSFDFAKPDFSDLPEELKAFEATFGGLERVLGCRIRITAREFSELYGIQLKYAYDQLRTAFNSLMNKQISFKSGQYTRKTQWLWDGGYHDGQGYVDLLLSNVVVEHCRDIEKHFTLYPLSQAGQLRLDSSWKLYALLSRHADTGLIRRTLDDFCDEVDAPPSYRKAANLRIRLIEPALAEIKEQLGLKVSYKLIKVGRTFAKIELRFDPANWKNQQQELKLKPDNTRSSSDTKENRKRVTAAVMDIEDTNW